MSAADASSDAAIAGKDGRMMVVDRVPTAANPDSSTSVRVALLMPAPAER